MNVASPHRQRNFLELHMAELLREAEKQRRLARRLGEERQNCQRVALERLQEAHRLESEANAIHYCLELISTVERRRRLGNATHREVDDDVLAAAALIRATPPDHGHDRIVYRAIADVAIGTVALATWDELCARTHLGVSDIAKSLNRLEEGGYLETLQVGTGKKPMKWAVK